MPAREEPSPLGVNEEINSRRAGPMSTLFTSICLTSEMRLWLLKHFLNKRSTCKQGFTSQTGHHPVPGANSRALFLLIQQNGHLWSTKLRYMDLLAGLSNGGNANHQGTETSKKRPGSNHEMAWALPLLPSALLWHFPLLHRGNGKHL